MASPISNPDENPEPTAPENLSEEDRVFLDVAFGVVDEHKELFRLLAE